MKLKIKLAFIAFLVTGALSAQQSVADRIVANPLNLSYRFQTEGNCRREAADPVIVLYNDTYYLFASHTSGYWYSKDLKNWEYVRSLNLKTVEAWAPAVFVYKNAIYYLAMGETRLYRSTDPVHDQWEEVEADLQRYGDPAFFQDDDGRVYLYHGCSDWAPIKGVEVDPENGFKPVTSEVDLIPHNSERFGWEVFGDKNENYKVKGWNEAPCISRHGDYYYLQYSAPGTELTTYCTGIYISKNPLGPYHCMPGAPFSIKPGGFIPGAGHGHPFKDRYGNDWYVGTMIMAGKDRYERRIGIFPAYYQGENAHAITDYTDFPFILPNKKVDFGKGNLSAGMNLLSYGKAMKTSSSYPFCGADKAADNNIKTIWSATTGQKGEWLQMDLGKLMDVSAVQICFADEGFATYRNDKNIPVYQYIIEYSTDRKVWNMMADRSGNAKDQIYELIPLKKKVQARFVRVRNTKDFQVGRFSIADMRLFGKAKGKEPGVVSDFLVKRNEKDRRRIAFSWRPVDATTGYVIRWGAEPGQLGNAAMVYSNDTEFGFFDRDLSYYMTIEAFSETGKGKCSPCIKVN